MITKNGNYTTNDELVFISHLGQMSLQSRRAGREACLVGYILGSEHRTNWGKVDKNKAIGHAHAELAQVRVMARYSGRTQ